MARTLKFKKETETAPRPYLAIQRELQNTVHNQQQIFWAQTQQMERQTDFFKNVIIFMLYILLLFFF